jgi:hypothetical protein
MDVSSDTMSKPDTISTRVFADGCALFLIMLTLLLLLLLLLLLMPLLLLLLSLPNLQHHPHALQMQQLRRTASKRSTPSQQLVDQDDYHPQLGHAFFSVRHPSDGVLYGAGGLKHAAGLLHALSPDPAFLQSIATIEDFKAWGMTKTEYDRRKNPVKGTPDTTELGFMLDYKVDDPTLLTCVVSNDPWGWSISLCATHK